MDKEYLRYENNNIKISINENDFITFLGEYNETLLSTLMFDKLSNNIFINREDSSKMSLYKIKRHISYVLNRDLNIFVSDTVEDELAFPLEGLSKGKNEIREIISIKSREFRLNDLLKRSPSTLGVSDKAKLKILSSMIFEPKVLILDNIFEELDYDDKKRVVSLLKEYTDKGNIVLNFTNNIEESLYGNKVVITSIDSVLLEGKTLSVLNEEKILKKLGYGLPFIVELNKYLIDYEIIKRYELDMEKLVGKIWK